MSDDSERPRRLIVAPKANAKKAVGRAVIEAAAGIGPIAGFLSRLYQTNTSSQIRNRSRSMAGGNI